MKYRDDYKTSDPAWYVPHNKALLGEKAVIKFKKLATTAVLPEYQTKEAAGMDLCAAENKILPAGKVTIIGTGLAMALPPGFEAQIRPRSGLAAKNFVTVLNTPGTIDADYRGEIKIILINHGDQDFRVEIGDRIAQMVIAPVSKMKVTEVAVLDDTERGEGGLGSTGLK